LFYLILDIYLSIDKIKSMTNRRAKTFIYLSGLGLLITGIAKLTTITGDVKLLNELDPIVGLQFWMLLAVAGIVELIVGAQCFLSSNHLRSVLSIFTLSLTFLSYRIGLWFTGWTKPCSCLGDLTQAIGMTEQNADNIAKLMLGFFIIGSVMVLASRHPIQSMPAHKTT